MRSLTSLILATLCAMILAPAAQAQVNEEFADITTQVEAARTLMRTDRKLLIMQEMSLTSAEAEKFWPLYEKYMNEITSVNDLRVKLVTDYAANYENLSDDMADALLEDFFDWNGQVVKTRKKYVKRFKKIVPATKVMRFFQLENKLDAIVNFNVASQVPLIQTAE